MWTTLRQLPSRLSGFATHNVRSSSSSTCSRTPAVHMLVSRRTLMQRRSCMPARIGLRRAQQSSSSQPQSPVGGRPTSAVSWKSMAAILVAGGSLVVYFQNEKSKRDERKAESKTTIVGKAAIGGAFELTDQDGISRTEKDFLGQWSMLYFGFTFCPDICPEELDKMSEIITLLDNDTDERVRNAKVQPVFISLDPDRDTPEKMKAYIADFHPRLTALTGTKEQVKQIAKAYRVYYSKPIGAEGDDDYLLDHTIIMYFLDPNGEFVSYYGQNKNAEEAAHSIRKHILKFDK